MLDEVGRDVVRFIMLTRRNDQTLEFDFARVTEQSKDNPVFYVQYCHARCRSVLRHAAQDLPAAALTAEALAGAPLHRLAGVEGARIVLEPVGRNSAPAIAAAAPHPTSSRRSFRRTRNACPQREAIAEPICV